MDGMAEHADDPGLTLELVDRIRSGDQEAWNDLDGRIHDDLLFVIRCRLGAGLRTKVESADILQSVVLESMRELPRFAPRDESSLRHFLHVLVANKIRDRARGFDAQKRRGTLAMTESVEIRLADSAAPDVAYRQPERYLELERCLLRLPADMREAILLRKVEGLSSREAAEQMGRSDVAMRQLYARALARLTLLMDECSQ